MSRKQDLPHTDAAHVAPALAAIERARHAEPIVLKPDKSLAAAFEVIAANCLAQVRDNTPGVAAGDAESVHQMRVGLRRLRCLLRLLPRRIELPGTLVQELEWLSHTLGAARDGHVLASTTLPGLARSCVEPPNWRALRRTANATANASARTASGLATSDRFARLLKQLAAWLRQAICQTDLGARGGRRLAQSAKKEADAVLSRLHRKLLSAARKMRRGSDADRHRVRIAAKRLRYAAEFFQSMYRRKRCERYIERLAALQECLGWCNDAVVADGLLGRLARKGMATAGDARAARCLLSRATPAGRKELRKRWKEFRSSRPP